MMNRLFWPALKEALAFAGDPQSFSGDFPQQAAVLVLITDEVSPQIIYTLRAKHLNHHAGEVCFPGGKWEQQDVSWVHCSTCEESENRPRKGRTVPPFFVVMTSSAHILIQK